MFGCPQLTSLLLIGNPSGKIGVGEKMCVETKIGHTAVLATSAVVDLDPRASRHREHFPYQPVDAMPPVGDKVEQIAWLNHGAGQDRRLIH